MSYIFHEFDIICLICNECFDYKKHKFGESLCKDNSLTAQPVCKECFDLLVNLYPERKNDILLCLTSLEKYNTYEEKDEKLCVKCGLIEYNSKKDKLCGLCKTALENSQKKKVKTLDAWF